MYIRLPDFNPKPLKKRELWHRSQCFGDKWREFPWKKFQDHISGICRCFLDEAIFQKMSGSGIQLTKEIPLRAYNLSVKEKTACSKYLLKTNDCNTGNGNEPVTYTAASATALTGRNTNSERQSGPWVITGKTACIFWISLFSSKVWQGYRWRRMWKTFLQIPVISYVNS